MATIETDQLIFQRQIGGNKVGKVAKEMPISKGNKGRKNASIPGKFVVNLEERGKKSGFGTSSIRFNYLMQNES
jgi:hypothetical protein